MCERSELTTAGEGLIIAQKNENQFPLLGRGKKAAFTLAEVLITLGIIGIVSALTLPSLLTNYSKKETAVRLEKSYSLISQAIKHSEVNNEFVKYWNFTLNAEDFFNKYFKDYIKYTKEYTAAELWNIAPRKNLDGGTYTGTTYIPSNTRSYHIVLSDGTIISFNNETNMWMGIDINGLKKPNQIGKDTFLFVFSSEYGLQPLGGDGMAAMWSFGKYDRDKILSNKSNYGCNEKSSGYWCTAVIMRDGWDIAPDYPW